MSLPKIVIFDVDGTLAESFQPPKDSTVALLYHLLDRVPIAIMSGAGFDRISHDFLTKLEKSPHISNLYVLPNSSTQAYTWQGAWNEEYNFVMADEERSRIKKILDDLADSVQLVREAPAYGPRIADRGAQIAYTVVGLDAPQEIKMAWDPDATKRRLILQYLSPRLPQYDIRTGGASTIDITAKGMNKAYGVKWLSEKLHVQPKDMLYIGDALYEGGNDAVVIPTGVQTQPVTSPLDTERIIENLLAA